KQFNHSSAFLDPYLRITLFAFLAGAVLAVFGNAFAQQRQTKSTRNVAQKQSSKTGVPRTGPNFWVQTNGPQGGDGIALATNPSGHVFVGTQGGGVFRSTDNGETWTGINNGLTDTNVRALAINSSDHIFAGTWSSGVFRSTDNGESWTEVNDWLTNPCILSSVINENGDIVGGADSPGELFCSTEEGNSWTRVDNYEYTSSGITALLAISRGAIFAGFYS